MLLATGKSVLWDFFSTHSLFCFKGIGMEQVSVGFVHIQLCLYLPSSDSLEAKAKLTLFQTLCLLNFLNPKAKPEASRDLYQ